MKYEKGDKFIIEIKSKLANGLYKIKDFNTLVFDDHGLDRLEQIQERRLCEDCEYERTHSYDYPCNECKQNILNHWTPKTEEIQVGDQVKFTSPSTQESEYGIVLQKYNKLLRTIDRDLMFRSWKVENCKRTGKTYPELIKALESLPKE